MSSSLTKGWLSRTVADRFVQPGCDGAREQLHPHIELPGQLADRHLARLLERLVNLLRNVVPVASCKQFSETIKNQESIESSAHGRIAGPHNLTADPHMKEPVLIT